MPIVRLAGVAIFAATVTLAGCASESISVTSDPAPNPSQTRDYAMVFIKTGPLRTPTPEQQAEAMQGHRANMQRLAAEGSLLIAGPLTEPRSDPDHRGIFVFDADTADKGLALANTDPAAQMGVFVMQPVVLSTDAPLTELSRLEAEYEQQRMNDPDVPDEWVGRMYVLASTTYDAALHEHLRATEGVLIAACLRDEGDGKRLLLWLDAPNPQIARGMLPEADWTMHGWYGSPTIAELPGLNPAG